MKYLWPLAALLCIDAAHADILAGDYIRHPDLPNCNPHAALPVTDGWPLEIAIPRNCAAVSTSNPVFVWSRKKFLPSGNWKAFFELKDGTGRVIHTAPISDTRYILPISLNRYSGNQTDVYSWTVSYSDNSGTYKSAPRQFIVNGENALLTADKIVLAAKSRAHPRALERKIDDETIYDSYARVIGAVEASAELTAAFTATEAEAQKFVAKVSPGYERYFPSSNDTPDTLAQGVIRERRAIEILGQWYFLTQAKTPGRESAQARAYLTECRDRLLALAKWPLDPTSPTHQSQNDQANREAMLGLALGWDLFQARELAGFDSSLKPTANELDEIRRVAMLRINAAIDGAGDKAGFDTLATRPYNSHVISAAHYATEALMYLVRPEDNVNTNDPKSTDAATRLDKSWRTLVTSVGTWGGTSDGGFGNGSNYAWYSTTKNARTLAAVRLITGHDLTGFAPIGSIGTNVVAQTPPADTIMLRKQMGTFGDGAEIDNHFQDYAGIEFRMLAYATRLPIYEWYWRTLGSFVTTGKPLPPYSFLLTEIGQIGNYPMPNGKPEVPPVPDSFLFEDAGYIAFHSKTTDPKRTSLYFRSSPQGTASHAEADHNAFVFVSRGQDVLINSGFYGEWGDPHFEKWTRHTMSKNALTMKTGYGSEPKRSGVGQAQFYNKEGVFNGTIFESREPGGKLVNYYPGTDNNRWRIATGDATAAYQSYDEATTTWRPWLDSAIRTVAYLKGEKDGEGVVLIYDYAHSDEARTWELNFHTPTAPIVTSTAMTITTPRKVLADGQEVPVNGDGPINTCVSLHGPRMTATTFDNSALDKPKATKYVRPQWHTRYTQTDYRGEDYASKYFFALTVIKENCAQTVTVTPTNSSEIRADIGNQWIVFNRGKVEFSSN